MSGPCLETVAVCTLGTVSVRPQDVTHTRTRACPTPFQANKLFQPSYKDRAPAERLSRNTSSAAIAPFNHCWQPKSSKQSVCLESAFFMELFGSEDHSFLRLSLPIFKRLDILLFQRLTILSNHYTPRPVAKGDCLQLLDHTRERIECEGAGVPYRDTSSPPFCLTTIALFVLPQLFTWPPKEQQMRFFVRGSETICTA